MTKVVDFYGKKSVKIFLLNGAGEIGKELRQLKKILRIFIPRSLSENSLGNASLNQCNPMRKINSKNRCKYSPGN